MTERELEESGLSDDESASFDWFYAAFLSGGRLDGDEVPTHWMPLPPSPGDE